ncbi:hypothetical protein V1511DRAFT_504917 [Dipodascopsis uninucleata]
MHLVIVTKECLSSFMNHLYITLYDFFLAALNIAAFHGSLLHRFYEGVVHVKVSVVLNSGLAASSQLIYNKLILSGNRDLEQDLVDDHQLRAASEAQENSLQVMTVRPTRVLTPVNLNKINNIESKNCADEENAMHQSSTVYTMDAKNMEYIKSMSPTPVADGTSYDTSKVRTIYLSRQKYEDNTDLQAQIPIPPLNDELSVNTIDTAQMQEIIEHETDSTNETIIVGSDSIEAPDRSDKSLGVEFDSSFNGSIEQSNTRETTAYKSNVLKPLEAIQERPEYLKIHTDEIKIVRSLSQRTTASSFSWVDLDEDSDDDIDRSKEIPDNKLRARSKVGSENDSSLAAVAVEPLYEERDVAETDPPLEPNDLTASDGICVITCDLDQPQDNNTAGSLDRRSINNADAQNDLLHLPTGSLAPPPPPTSPPLPANLRSRPLQSYHIVIPHPMHFGIPKLNVPNHIQLTMTESANLAANIQFKLYRPIGRREPNLRIQLANKRLLDAVESHINDLEVHMIARMRRRERIRSKINNEIERANQEFQRYSEKRITSDAIPLPATQQPSSKIKIFVSSCVKTVMHWPAKPQSIATINTSIKNSSISEQFSSSSRTTAVDNMLTEPDTSDISKSIDLEAGSATEVTSSKKIKQTMITWSKLWR